ncbi:MAG TPA: glycoside hydrolase family 3 protein [Thermoanaerobaculia bacterium]
MKLREKAGQLFAVAVKGGDPLDEVARHVRENHVGGVIWFLSTIRETADANRMLQSLAIKPLLVSADLESGLGMRFSDAIWWPPAMALAAAGDIALAEAQAAITARSARVLGINHILAPVADVNVNPDNPVINTRSFGENPDQVARFVVASVKGIQSEGCLATAKHFPGHGDTHVDSHRSLPLLDASMERLEAVELVPFEAAIEAGVASVMIGHLAVPSIDSTPAPVRASFDTPYGTTLDEVPSLATIPATLSRPIIEGLLRQRLRFDGLVISDAFDMGGVAAHFDAGEAAVRAIEAGIDQVLYSSDTDAAIAAVMAAVEQGRLDEARLDESVARIESARTRIGAPRSEDLSFIDRPEHREIAEEIARRSMTLIRDERGLLPLRGKVPTAVVVSDFPEENPLVDAVRELTPERVHIINTATSDDELSDIDGDVVVLLLALRPKSGAGRIALPPAARRLAERLGRRTVAISFGSPYVVRDLPSVSTVICAWGIQPLLQRAAVRALRGQNVMPGRLPVTI